MRAHVATGGRVVAHNQLWMQREQKKRRRAAHHDDCGESPPILLVVLQPAIDWLAIHD
jgi:hypothetical protein